MRQDFRLALRITVAMLVLAQALALTGIVTGPIERLLRNPTADWWVFSVGAMGLHAFILFAVYTAPNWRPIVAAILAGLALDSALIAYVPGRCQASEL